MMEQGSSRVVKTKAEWAAIIEGQERSGASAARFCREQGIDYNRFLYRRQTLRVASRDTALAAAREGSQKSNRSLAMAGLSRGVSVAGGFIPVRVEEGADVRLRFPMGLVLESDRIPSAAWVVEVARRWTDGEGSPC